MIQKTGFNPNTDGPAQEAFLVMRDYFGQELILCNYFEKCVFKKETHVTHVTFYLLFTRVPYYTFYKELWSAGEDQEFLSQH